MTAPPPEIVSLARQLYVDGAPVETILRESKLSAWSLYQCLDGVAGEERLPPIPRRKATLGLRRRPARVSRASLISRLWTTAERQVRDIEQRLCLKQQEPLDRERDARVLSVLVKTLRDLSAFDEEQGEAASSNEADDDFPRDADELRRELARKIEGLRLGHAAGAGGSETA